MDEDFGHLSKVKGTLVDKQKARSEEMRSAEMAVQLKDLPSTEIWRTLPDEQRNFKRLLSGESVVNSQNKYQLDTAHLQSFILTDTKRRRLTLHRQFDTGADLKKLSTEQPNERYKFYLSLDLSTLEKQQFAREFSTHLLTQCKERGISLTSKSMDHDYDSWNLYTWHPRELAEVLTLLYPQYQDTGIFLDTRHWMQGALTSIPIAHIGWVQEPVSGGEADGISHSARMAYLGGALDEGKSYEEACRVAGVRPGAPWLLEQASAA